MKRVSLLLVLLLAILLNFGCTSGDKPTPAVTSEQGNEVFEIKLTHIMTETHPYHAGVLAFINKLEELGFKDNVKISIYPNAQLGSEVESIESMQKDIIQMGVVASTLSNYVPEVDRLKVPFLFRDVDHFYKVVDGPVGDDLKGIIQDKSGLKVLGVFGAGERHFFTKKPLNTLADMKGIKIRVMQNNLHIKSFNALGLISTPLSLNETYSALQSDLVHGVELDPITFETNKLQEVVKNMTFTRHLVGCGFFVVSDKLYQSMPKELQEAFIEAGKAAEKAERDEWSKMDQGVIKDLEDSGVLVSELPPDETSKMRAVIVDKVYPEFSEVVTKELVDAVNKY